MTDTSEPEPALDWETAPDQFREAHRNATEQLNRLKEESASAAQIRRENVMLKAGIDPTHPFYPIFSTGYTGKEDVDSVKEEWGRITGNATPPHQEGQEGGPPPAPGSTEGLTPEQEAQARALEEARGRLQTGATAPGEEPTPHPADAAKAAADKQRELGRSRGQQSATYLDSLFQAAAAGDPRITSSNYEDAKNKWKDRQGLR